MNSLLEPGIAGKLDELHQEARRDPEKRRSRSGGDENELVRMGELYLAISPEEGRFLYMLARGCRALNLVEFGASFGISTTYLAAAAQDNGGRLITTEVHPDKCAALRRLLGDVGLDASTTVLEGDARETLRDVAGPIDLLFLDGWKSQYLPLLEMLLPKLREGAFVVADNIDHEAAHDYAERVRAGTDFVSRDMGKQELSCYTG